MKNIIKNMIDRYKKIPIAVRAGIWLTLCSLIQKGISVITVPVFTRILSTEDYGLVSVFVSWTNIIILFTGLSLHTGVFNTAMIKYNKQHNRVVSSFLGLTTTLSVVTFAFYLLFRQYINAFLGMSTFLVCLMFVKILLSSAYNLWMSQERYEYNYKPFVIITLSIAVLVPLIGYFCVINSNDKAIARITSMTIIECVFYLGIFLYIFSKDKTFYSKELWTYGIKFNVPLIPHYLSGSILNQADRIMISSMVGNSEAGIYSVGYSAAMLMQIVVSSIMSSFIPWQYSKIKTEKINGIKECTNVMCIITALVCILFSLLAPELLLILATNEYRQAIYMFPPLTVSVYFLFVYNFFVNIELYYEKKVLVTIASCITAVLNIILNYIAIKYWGYIAAAYTTLICYVFYAIIHYIFMKNILKNKNVKNMYDGRLILILSIGVIVLSIFVNWLYTYMVLRYLFVLLILLICILNRNVIINNIKLIKNK